ncbi:uncharacterized protein [Chironomus tepperi]|uniref:uncharacterized protein n=1 Tax=Chironomus tepperi TaxID=113505 RepID=UPI00391F57DB
MWKFILLLALCSSAHCWQNTKKINKSNSKSLSTFAGEIYQKSVEGQSGNVIISPISIRSVLTMALFGAPGSTITRKEMINGLKYKHSDKNEKIAETYEKLTKSTGENGDVKIANKIYVMKKYTIKPKFQELVMKGFKSKAENIDFKKSDESAGIINKWIEGQTDNMISNLIQPDLLNNETRMILVNTVYFKGIWEYKFEALNFRNRPYKEPFYVSETESVDIEVMKLRENLFFGDFKDLDAKALRLPYKDSGIEMLVLLPNKRTGLAGLEENLTEIGVKRLWSKMQKTKVDVQMPKFKIEYQVDLKAPLEEMGMKRMFTDDAEFGNLINSTERLHISKVIHKSMIEVDETGSKAASATAGLVLVSRMGGDSEEEKEENFYAKHPFLFYLIEKKTTQILFLGRVAKFFLIFRMWKFILLLALCSSAHCWQNTKKINKSNSKSLSTFAGEIYQKSVEGQSGNVIISPISIRSVLTMALFGAPGSTITRKEMINGLKYKHSDKNDKIAETYERLTKSTGENGDVKIANKIYVMKKYTIKPKFQELVMKGFKSKAENIDFKKSDESAGIINKWIEGQTDNMISNLIQPDLLNNETRMILVNTVYFKGIWEYKFEALNFRNRPYKEPFYVSETESVDIEVMKLRENLFYNDFKDLDAKALRLPYKDSGIEMLVLLPNKRTGLAGLEKNLTEIGVKGLWSKMQKTKVDVQMPKFKIEYQVDLKAPLEKMGMKRMFTYDAEFGNLINSTERLHISKVIHKSMIKVNEIGSKAPSAATVGIVFVSRMGIDSEEDIEDDIEESNFYAEHPFLFYLIEKKITQILFLGRVAKF